MPLRVGVLALQGAVQPHFAKLQALDEISCEVRTPEQLSQVDALILPGGESTTMLKLLHFNQLWEPLRDFVSQKPVWGLCAGAILLAKSVSEPKQESLNAIDLSVTRNAYGRQLDSFITKDLQLDPMIQLDAGEAAEGVFIRAPSFDHIGATVQTLVSYKSNPVMVKSAHVLAASFHPELATGLCFHRYFVQLVRNGNF